jgi:hypothetical protein
VVGFNAKPGMYFDRGNFFRFPDEVRFRFYLKNAKLYAFKATSTTPSWPEPKD